MAEPNKKRRVVLPVLSGLGGGELGQVAELAREVGAIKGVIHEFGDRLGALDTKVSAVLEKCLQILDAVMMTVPQYKDPLSTSVLFNSAISSKEVGLQGVHTPVEGVTQSSQIIRLNREDSYPEGSWLGDPHSPDERVRVPLTPQQLHQLDSGSQAPEKLALSLLEALFPRSVLATSNLTGRGKHKKKQLDPLFIFGIYCHLRYKFGIQERDWARIRNNMDAKCRFFWSRRNKGFPLGGNNRRMDQGKEEEEEGEEDVCKIEVGEPSYLLQSVWDGHGTLVAVEEGQEEVYQLDTQNLVLGEELMMSGTVMVTTHNQQVIHRSPQHGHSDPPDD